MARMDSTLVPLGLALALALPACGDDGSSASGGSSGSSGTGGSTSTTATSLTTTTTTTTTTTASTTGMTTAADSSSTSGPGTDTATGTSTGTGTETDTATGSSTGAAGYSVSGNFSRTAAAYIFAGNDGIGDAYIGLLVSCDQTAMSVAGVTVTDADISDTNSMVPYTIEGVPDGDYFLAGFFDDNQNADMMDPSPDQGDMAYSSGFSIACVPVTVDGADVTGADIAFNTTIPF